MIKRSRVKYTRRFNFLLTEQMQTEVYKVADLANEDAAEIVRCMINRELPYFLSYASTYKRLPSCEVEPTKEAA